MEYYYCTCNAIECTWEFHLLINHHPNTHREFPGGDEVDLDPSLQDGMPPREDLRRYSRDYYVGSSTSRTALQDKNSSLSHPKHPQNQSPASIQQQLTNGYHSLPTTTQQVTRNGQVCHAVLQMHDKAPCMSGGGAEDSQLPQTLPEASSANSQHSSTILTSPGSGNTTIASEGCEGIFSGPSTVHSVIIEKFNKGRAPSPNSAVNHMVQEGVRSSKGSLSSNNQFSPATVLKSHTSSNQVRQLVSQVTPTTQSSPLSSLVTPLHPESPGIGELEGSVMRHSVTRLSFRSRQATREFSLNPLFEDELKVEASDCMETQNPQRARHSLTSSHPSEPSSDYYSSYESLPYLSSFSREGSLRLPKPKVTEEVLETLSDIGGSLRLPQKKSPLKSWGSFKHKKNMMF